MFHLPPWAAGKAWNTPALCSDFLSPRPPTSVSSITEASKLLEELESIKRFVSEVKSSPVEKEALQTPSPRTFTSQQRGHWGPRPLPEVSTTGNQLLEEVRAVS